jgi:Outer membrane protein beta-barrel domain
MKTQIKKSLGVLALLFASFSTMAQTTTSDKTSSGVIYSVGVESGLTLNDQKDYRKWNLGGSLQVDVPIVNQLYFTANVGYLDYFGRNNVRGTNYSASDMNTLPVMAGFKYFLIPMLYVQGDAGASFLLNKDAADYSKSAAFLYVPQVGVKIPLGGRNYLDAGVRYEGTTKFDSDDKTSKLSTIGLRVAYAFGGK